MAEPSSGVNRYARRVRADGRSGPRPADHRLGRYRRTVKLRVVLGHGASGTAASMAPFVDGLRARGIDATAVDLPKRKAEDVVPRWLELAPPGPDVIVGGHSYGGRVASLAAATAASGAGGAAAGYRGLVCFSYPLHRPGGPELGARIAHLPAIACPALLLSGESDPFARIDLLREAIAAPAARRAGHLPASRSRPQRRPRRRPRSDGGVHPGPARAG